MYYSKLKILHHWDKLDALANGEITGPVHIRIKPTNFCNHNCSYCSYQNSYGQLGKDMKVQDQIPFPKLLEIVEDCEAMGVRALTFSGGGEPLLHKDMATVLRYAHMAGIRTAMLTNGILLKDELADAVLKYCTWIRISMDGWDRKSYAKYRNCPEDHFDILMDNIRNATSSGHECIVGVNIIVTWENASHIYRMVRMVHEAGVRSIKISPCITSNDAKKNSDYHFIIKPILHAQLKNIERAGIEIYNSYHIQLEGFKKNYTWCPYIQVLPIIGADQNVYVCHDKAYNKDTGILGSIKDRSFKDFWFDGENKFYRIDPSKHCNHHCITDATNRMLMEYLKVEHLEFV